MRRQYIIAYDVGTGGTKAVLTDIQGRIVKTSYKSHQLYYPRAGWVEQKPDELWFALAHTTKRVISLADIDPSHIIGMGVSAQMFNLLPVDEHCTPLSPMISWLDVRSIEQAEGMKKGDMLEFLFQHTGNFPTAKDIVPKILWLKEECPDIWHRTYKVLDCKEYIIYKLTGKFATDWHGASVYFLFDPHKKSWSKLACRRLGIPVEKLPAAYPCTQVIGEVTEEAGKRIGLNPGTPVVICAGDVAVAQSGSGSNANGRAHLCIGTATWIGVSSNKFMNDYSRPFWILNHIDPEKWIIAGEMETGGGALMWFRDAFCQGEIDSAETESISTYNLLNRMADSIQPGSDRLIFAPWLTGERAPVLNHLARGAFVGLSINHTKGHLVRSVMEGVAYHLRWIFESMRKIGLDIREVNAIGGGCNSRLWTQIISDVMGCALHIVENPLEAGAIGAALAVAVGMGIYPDMDTTDKLIGIDRVVTPRTENRDRYDDLYGEYLEVYTALEPIFRRLYRSR